MGQRIVLICDKCGEDMPNVFPVYATHADSSHKVELCHSCTAKAVAELLVAHERGEKYNGTRFLNEFTGMGGGM